MDNKKHGLSCEEVKQWDMVNYLSQLGYEPAKVRNTDYWYLSPLRNENTPSFKVNRKLNRWYDHGLGKGGSLVDFGILFYQCDVSGLLQKLNTGISFHQPIHTPSERPVKESRITILQDFEITAKSLLHYLEQRKIDTDIATRYCREVRYSVDDKTYYAIGFKNDSGGYELRNPFFKSSSSPKDITVIRSGLNNKHVAVFEGFFDFLSYLTNFKVLGTNECDFVILNSVSQFEKARPHIEQYQKASLYLDNDVPGQNCSAYALSLSNIYSDASSLYKGHKDLNNWLVSKAGNNTRVVQKKRIRQKRQNGPY